ncbi:MAG TPA: hypothetical protein VJQ56_03735 [Blastocatellia bacterium]|nr:hypothetical protein [Blastocatellia bacterium]
MHRSHARGPAERIIKSLTRYRPYRCLRCGWRGWLTEVARPGIRWRSVLKDVVSMLVVIFLVLLAFYMTGVD